MKWPMRAPPTKMTITALAAIRHAVEKSGSRAIGRMMQAQPTRNGASPLKRFLRCSRLRTSSAAVQTTAASLARSEGCRVNPTLSHLRAPFTSRRDRVREGGE